MLGLAKRLRAKILQASTSEICGDPSVHSQGEDYWGHVNPIGPRSCYDEGKRCAETLFFDYWRQHKLAIKVARIFNTYESCAQKATSEADAEVRQSFLDAEAGWLRLAKRVAIECSDFDPQKFRGGRQSGTLSHGYMSGLAEPMARLIFVNRYFFPDHSATSQVLSDLTFHLAVAGHDVHVIASTQIYDQPDADLPGRETINQVDVHRVASTRFGRAALPGRALDYLSFYHSVRRHLGEIVRAGDTVIVKTDPPLLSVALASIAQQRRVRLVNWLQDIYPETATVLGVPLVRGPIASALATLRNHSLRVADATVVVGELMARRIEAQGVEVARIHVIRNWCDDETIKPVPQADNPLRENWQLVGKFVIGYSGNLGRAHEFETMLAAAERLRDQADIVFLMIGGGNRFEQLVRAVKARGLEHSFCFRSYQDRAMLPYSLSVPDVHWLSLDPQLEGLIVPSKFYGIAAAGRPIVMIGDNDGEIARLVREHRCGISVAPGDAESLADTLRRWSKAPQATSEMGARARQMLDAQFTKRRALEQWSQLLERIAG